MFKTQDTVKYCEAAALLAVVKTGLAKSALMWTRELELGNFQHLLQDPNITSAQQFETHTSLIYICPLVLTTSDCLNRENAYRDG